MTWIEVMPATCGVLYLAAAVGYGAGGQNGLCLAYIAYALANVGLVWAAVEGRS